MIMPSEKYLKEKVIRAKEHDRSMNEFYHNADEVMAYRGIDINGKKLAEASPARNYGVFMDPCGTFVHSMMMLDEFVLDQLANELVYAKRHGNDPNEFLPYALEMLGIDPDTELSDYQVSYLQRAVSLA